MREDDFLKGGRVLLVTEPIKGQDGILKLSALANDIMKPKPGEEVWTVFLNTRQTRIKIIHIDTSGVDLLTRKLSRGAVGINLKLLTKEQTKLTRGDLRRFLFDGTLPGGGWSSQIAQSYYEDHPEDGYFGQPRKKRT